MNDHWYQQELLFVMESLNLWFLLSWKYHPHPTTRGEVKNLPGTRLSRSPLKHFKENFRPGTFIETPPPFFVGFTKYQLEFKVF